MGRPQIILRPEQVVEVETLAALLSQEQIADYFGIGRRTFRAICARDEEVMVRYKWGNAKAIAHVANGLLQKARAGCTTSSIFYLKTQAGWNDRPDLARGTAPHADDQADAHAAASRSGAEKLRRFLDDIAARMQADGDTDAAPDPVIAGALPVPEDNL